MANCQLSIKQQLASFNARTTSAVEEGVPVRAKQEAALTGAKG